MPKLFKRLQRRSLVNLAHFYAQPIEQRRDIMRHREAERDALAAGADIMRHDISGERYVIDPATSVLTRV